VVLHSEHSSYREKLLEHLFIGEVQRYLWCQDVTTAELLRPDVDSGGYDLVIACNTVIRHIQLKSSHVRGDDRPPKRQHPLGREAEWVRAVGGLR
jgi:hypothetical protein